MSEQVSLLLAPGFRGPKSQSEGSAPLEGTKHWFDSLGNGSLIAAGVCCASLAHAQSLLRTEPPKPALDEKSNPVESENLHGYSLTLVEPPEQRQFRIHDQIQILIQ